MRLNIKILADTQHGEVWLWLRVVGQLNGVLDAENGTVSNLTTHERIQPFDNRSMAWSDRTHGAYLAVYQLDTVIFSEDPRLVYPCQSATVNCQRRIWTVIHPHNISKGLQNNFTLELQYHTQLQSDTYCG